MADTVRSSADLLANLFQDGQAASSITAQDLRDLIVSMLHSNGAFSMVTPAATTISVAGTYYKAAGTTLFATDDATAFDDDSGTSNRIKYIGTPDKHCEIRAVVSLTCSGSNQVLGFKIAKNGVVIDTSSVRHTIGSGSEVIAISVSGYEDVSADDYFELFVTNETSTATITIEEIAFFVDGSMH